MRADPEEWRGLRYGIPGALALAALLIRFPGLGKWCISSDEYFLSRSISYLQESGLPAFPSGGYYVRGILLQYLMAVPVWGFPDREFALRLVPLAFGILTVPLVYVFCRKRMPVLPSFLCSAILVLSSWHIEFSRFARFYSVFQFVFFVFLHHLHAGYCVPAARNRYVSWAVAVLAVFVFEGSIFLPFLLLGVVLLQEENIFVRKTRDALLVFAPLVALNYLVNGIDYKNWGVRDRLPAAAVPESGTGLGVDLPFVLPSTDILSFAWGSAGYLFLYLLLLGAGAYVFHRLYRRIDPDRETWTWLFAGAALVLPLVHLYGLLGILAIVLLVNRPKVSRFLQRNGKVLACYWGITASFWTAMILLSGNRNKILHFLVGYPAAKGQILTPFSESVPVFGMAAAGVLVLSAVHSAFSERDPERLFIWNVLSISLFLVAFFKVPEQTTRYCFFFFPLIFVLAYQETDSLVRWIGEKRGESAPARFGGVLFAVPFLLFMATEEFHPSHVLDVASREANFRIGRYARFQDHWYERFDYESPAEYVNRHHAAGDEVVIDSNPFSDYLEVPARFFSPTDIFWFPQFSRNFGTLEVWSGYPMITSVRSIVDLVPNNGRDVLWLVTKEQISSGDHVSDIARKHDLHVEHVHTGVDNRFKVWKITRNDRTRHGHSGSSRRRFIRPAASSGKEGRSRSGTIHAGF